MAKSEVSKKLQLTPLTSEERKIVTAFDELERGKKKGHGKGPWDSQRRARHSIRQTWGGTMARRGLQTASVDTSISIKELQSAIAELPAKDTRLLVESVPLADKSSFRVVQNREDGKTTVSLIVSVPYPDEDLSWLVLSDESIDAVEYLKSTDPEAFENLMVTFRSALVGRMDKLADQSDAKATKRKNRRRTQKGGESTDE